MTIINYTYYKYIVYDIPINNGWPYSLYIVYMVISSISLQFKNKQYDVGAKIK